MGATDPEEGRQQGHHPRRLRRQHRRQRRARLRRCRNRRRRGGVLLPGHERLRPLIAAVARSCFDERTWRSTCSTSISTGWPPTASSWARSAFARPSCSAGSTSKGESDFARMSDLAESLREKLAGSAPRLRRSLITRAGLGRRHRQVAVRRRRRQRRRDGVHPRRRSRHAVRLVAGRLRGRLPLLLHRPPGLQPQPDDRRDRRPAVVCRASPAQAPEPGAGRARHHERRDDGHGRAAAELRGAGAGPARDARRPRLRPVAPPRHGVDLGRGAR